MSESELSQQAAAETLPLRDAFAVLFFVSIGMLFDPAMLVQAPAPLAATLFIILIGKSLVAFLIVRAFGHPVATALTISASLAQIGEFSFILAGLGVSLGLLSEAGRDLILAGAILSILANPLCFAAADRFGSWLDRREVNKSGVGHGQPSAAPVPTSVPTSNLKDHAILVGFGCVGQIVGEALIARNQPVVVIEENAAILVRLAQRGIDAYGGPAAPAELLAAANVANAKWLFVAISDGFAAGQFVQQARAANSTIEIIAHAHSEAEVDHLRRLGATVTVVGEREIAEAMLAQAPGAATSKEEIG